MHKLKHVLFKPLYIICASIICWSCNRPETACETFDSQLAKLSTIRGDTTKLVKTLTEILLEDSLCGKALIARADIFFQLEKFNLAEPDYRKVFKLDKTNTYVCFRLGQILQYKEDHRSALFFFNKAILQKTHNGIINDYVSPLKGVNSKAETDVNSRELFFFTAISFYWNGDLKNALATINYCIEKDYRLGESLFYRGAINFELGNKKEACRDLLEAKHKGNPDAEPYLREHCK